MEQWLSNLKTETRNTSQKNHTMQIRILFTLFTVTFILSACSSLPNLEKRKAKLLARKSYLVVGAFIDSCKKQDDILLSVNLNQLNTGLSDNDELKVMRARIDSSIVDMRNFLLSVDDYKELMDYAGQNGLRNREYSRAQRFLLDSLTRASDEYSGLRKKSISLIKENNLKIIELISEDYKKRGVEIPINWIPDILRIGILQNSNILETDKKIVNIDKTILEKYGNKNGAIS